MQTVYLRFPVPKHMLMCTASSNWCELAIVIGVGQESVCGITARSLITRHLPTYVYSRGVLRGKQMTFVGVVRTYIQIYTIYCTILVYLSSKITVALKPMLNAADSGYHWHQKRNVTYRIICFQHRAAVCTRTP